MTDDKTRKFFDFLSVDDTINLKRVYKRVQVLAYIKEYWEKDANIIGVRNFSGTHESCTFANTLTAIGKLCKAVWQKGARVTKEEPTINYDWVNDRITFLKKISKPTHEIKQEEFLAKLLEAQASLDKHAHKLTAKFVAAQEVFEQIEKEHQKAKTARLQHEETIKEAKDNLAIMRTSRVLKILPNTP